MRIGLVPSFLRKFAVSIGMPDNSMRTYLSNFGLSIKVALILDF